jgi:hypothetical protein
MEVFGENFVTNALFDDFTGIITTLFKHFCMYNFGRQHQKGFCGLISPGLIYWPHRPLDHNLASSPPQVPIHSSISSQVEALPYLISRQIPYL